MLPDSKIFELFLEQQYVSHRNVKRWGRGEETKKKKKKTIKSFLVPPPTPPPQDEKCWLFGNFPHSADSFFFLSMKHFPVVVIPLYIRFVYYFLFMFHHMLGQTLMSTSYYWVLQEPTALEVRSLCGNSPLGSVGLSRVVSESSLNVSSFPHALNCFFRVGAIPWHPAVLTFHCDFTLLRWTAEASSSETASHLVPMSVLYLVLVSKAPSSPVISLT